MKKRRLPIEVYDLLRAWVDGIRLVLTAAIIIFVVIGLFWTFTTLLAIFLRELGV